MFVRKIVFTTPFGKICGLESAQQIFLCLFAGFMLKKDKKKEDKEDQVSLEELIEKEVRGNRGKHLDPSGIRTLNPKVDRQALDLTELNGTSPQPLACCSVSLLHTSPVSPRKLCPHNSTMFNQWGWYP
jgi:hypothetical protein